MVARIARLRQAAFVTIALLVAPEARAENDDLSVDLELILSVDVSRSIDADERSLQRQGYVAALRHPEVVSAIQSGAYGRIAVTYVEWAGPTEQAVVMSWHLIEDKTTAEVAAAALDGLPLPGQQGTSISAALLFALRLFDVNGFAGVRQVIDISGDGPDNNGPSVIAARDQVIARGVVISGLPVVPNPGGRGGMNAPELESYFRDCVIGGSGAFFTPVATRETFADTIKRKLVREVAQHEPVTTLSWTIGRASIQQCETRRDPPRKWRVPPSINDHPFGDPSLADMEGSAPTEALQLM